MIIFTKPYRRLREGDPYLSSIIAYADAPYEIDGKTILSKKHFLYINLWLVQFLFDWITHYKKV